MEISSNKEIKYYFCNTHRDTLTNTYLQRTHPGYKFNHYSSFGPHTCSFSNCRDRAFYECIGIHIPNNIPLDLSASAKIKKEIFNSAKHVLDNGLAVDRLTVYLKSILIPTEVNLVSTKVIRYFSRSILKKLKIDERQSLSDVDKDRILQELSIYPADEE